MSTTATRRAAIRQLLAEQEVRSQSELLEALARRGFAASQPVLSRDLRALRVAKQDGVYRVVEDERITPLEALKSLVRGVQPVSHFVLVQCEAGAANAVARALEAEEVDGLAGTVAGDDTIIVALASSDAARRTRRLVAALL